MVYFFNIRITIWMLHIITKWLKICIDINIEISEVDNYTWIFTSRIFRLALEITFLLNKYFFLQKAYDLLLPSIKRKKRVVLIRVRPLENILKKKISRKTLIRDPRVSIKIECKLSFENHIGNICKKAGNICKIKCIYQNNTNVNTKKYFIGNTFFFVTIKLLPSYMDVPQ